MQHSSFLPPSAPDTCSGRGDWKPFSRSGKPPGVQDLCCHGIANCCPSYSSGLIWRSVHVGGGVGGGWPGAILSGCNHPAALGGFSLEVNVLFSPFPCQSAGGWTFLRQGPHRAHWQLSLGRLLREVLSLLPCLLEGENERRRLWYWVISKTP